MATENKYQKSIDRLNQAIGKEIATTLQYLSISTSISRTTATSISRK